MNALKSFAVSAVLAALVFTGTQASALERGMVRPAVHVVNSSDTLASSGAIQSVDYYGHRRHHYYPRRHHHRHYHYARPYYYGGYHYAPRYYTPYYYSAPYPYYRSPLGLSLSLPFLHFHFGF
jgi:hypothetical protein